MGREKKMLSSMTNARRRPLFNARFEKSAVAFEWRTPTPASHELALKSGVVLKAAHSGLALSPMPSSHPYDAWPI